MGTEDIAEMAGPEKTENDILVFSSEDERLKFLGQVLSNKSSRAVLKLLIENEMTLMQIADQANLNPTLVIHHLKKLLQCGVVAVTKTSTNRRGRPMKFYRAKPVLVIYSKDMRDGISSSSNSKHRSLFNALKKASKFTAIGLAGMVTWMVTSATAPDPLQSAFKYPRPSLPPYMAPIEAQGAGFFQADLVIPAAAAAGVVIAGLAIARMLSRQKQNPRYV